MSNLEKAKTTWEAIINTIFERDNTPDTFIWTNLDEIADVLNTVGRMSNNLNYMFLPLSGGIELDGCSNKGSYIDLIAGSNYSVKPHRLIFKYFEENPIESYFRLEAVATFYGCEGDEKVALEPVVDFSLEDRVYRVFGQYEGDMYSMHECSFVIFNKFSNYNKDRATDDGRHDKMSAEAFEKYIEKYYV